MACSCGNKCCHTKETIVPVEEVERFAKECLLVADVNEEHAGIISKILAHNDKIGINAYGLRSLDKYLTQIKNGTVAINIPPKILKENCATAWVDGCNCFGVIVAHYCMKLAIKKAKKVGIGCVVTKGSNEFSTGSSHSNEAAKEGLIGFVFSNGFPAMTVKGGVQAVLGSNPISMSAPPFEDDDGFVLDMAMTGSTREKVEVYAKLEKPIPENWALDSFGKVTTDPNKANTLLPIGWPSFDYKGFGLGMMVEALTSILAGADYGPTLNTRETLTPPQLSHCFIVIDPDRFAPCYPCRMSDLMTQIRTCEKVTRDTEIVLAGDPQKKFSIKVDEQYGIGYPPQLMEDFLKVAQTYAVSPLTPLPPLEMIFKKI